MIVAIYARVSLDKRIREKEQDPENQLFQLREFCARSGWTVFREYVDRMTGKTAERPEFKRMFADASRRHFEAVVFWSLDRFGRMGAKDTLIQLEQLQAWGVAYRSYQEGYIDSAGPFKDVLLALLASMAKLEREKISERTKAGISRARRAGKRIGRPFVARNATQLAQLRASGLSLREIAEKTGLKLTTVARTLKKARSAAA